MNEAEARVTGKDCIYDPIDDEWFIAADYLAQVAVKSPEPALAKAAPVLVKPVEAATPVDTQPLINAPSAPLKTGKK